MLKESARLEGTLTNWNALEELHGNLATAVELYEEEEEEDAELLAEIEQECRQLSGNVDSMEILSLFSGEHDTSDAIVVIHPGAGGTESTDWASMLYEMYRRWAVDEEYKLQELDRLPGEEAGIKSVTFSVQGHHAYGKLKAEIGVHRLVRISPFDAQKRRHTSFASVFVYADIEEEIDIDIKTDDLKVDTYRASGAGGQHVNTTDSAVRITHLPSRIVVQCQNERSQHKNRSTAMKMLKARLFDLEVQERNKEKDAQNAQKRDIAWGSQIRSYVLHPDKLVKDHRTSYESHEPERILDGDLDPFIHSFLKQAAKT